MVTHCESSIGRPRGRVSGVGVWSGPLALYHAAFRATQRVSSRADESRRHSSNADRYFIRIRRITVPVLPTDELPSEQLGGKQQQAQRCRNQRKQSRTLQINEEILENRRSVYRQAAANAHDVTFSSCRTHLRGQADAFSCQQYHPWHRRRYATSAIFAMQHCRICTSSPDFDASGVGKGSTKRRCLSR